MQGPLPPKASPSELSGGWKGRALQLCIALALFAPFLVNVTYTPDSYNYFAVARGLSQGLGFASRLLMPGSDVPRALDLWPPVFPAAWAALLRMGLPDTLSATLINALSLLLILLCLPRLGPSSASPRRFAIGALLLLGYTPFPFCLRHAWSEPLSIALLAAGFALDASTGARTGLRSALSGVLFGLSTLTRYPLGIAFAAAQLPRWLRTLRTRDGAEARNALAQACSFALIVAPWLARNQVLFGRLLGHANAPREPGTARDAVLQGMEALSIHGTLGWLGCAALTVWAFRSLRSERQESERSVAAVALFFPAYFVAICASAYRVQVDPIDLRLLAPLAVSFIPMASAALDALWTRLERSDQRALVGSGVFFAVLMTLPSIDNARKRSPALASARHELQPLVQWMEANVRPTDLVIGQFLLFGLDAFCPGYFMSEYPEFPALDAKSVAATWSHPELRGGRAYWLGAEPRGMSARLIEGVSVQRWGQTVRVWELLRDPARAAPVTDAR